METGFLNFHDAEHFSDFGLSFNQHDLVDHDPQSSLTSINDDFEYMESQMEISASLWGTEQELNGDLAVLPVAGVAAVVPKFDNITEDYGKQFTEWQDHFGYLQASDIEEDIGLAFSMHLPEKLNTDFPDNIFQDDHFHTSPVKDAQSTVSLEINYNNTTKENLSSYTSQSPMILEDMKPKIEDLDEKFESEDCVDVETISEHVPVLEAGDVKSLLEQFEASEASSVQSIVKSEVKVENNVKKVNTGAERPSRDKSKQALLKKSVKKQVAKHHKNIQDPLPKEVIDRIKASSRKKTISVIPPLSNAKNVNRGGTKKQKVMPLACEPKALKPIASAVNSIIKNDDSVQLDHDYCSNISSTMINADSTNKYDRKSARHKKMAAPKTTGQRDTIQLLPANELATVLGVEVQNWDKSSSALVKKDNITPLGDMSECKEGSNILTEPQTAISTTSDSSVNNVSINDSLKNAPDMKIRSVLAMNILQMRNGLRGKAAFDVNIHNGKPMVSVLKKPLMASTNESIVTTKNSSNDEVQNIIVQDASVPVNEIDKKPPKKKLNLAEYRNRRDQGRSHSHTCSPVQPMILVYIHNAFTTTEPTTDYSTNLVWSEKEILPMLKPKNEIDEAKNRPKPTTCNAGTQTYETVFSNSITANDQVETVAEVAKANEEPRKLKNYRPRQSSSTRSRSQSRSSNRSRSDSFSRSRNRSRSRSRSRNCSRSHSRRKSRRSRSSSRQSRTRSRSFRSRSRSYSRSLSRRRNDRVRRISNRRSSYSSSSSSSSWSSRSRSRSSYHRSRLGSSRSRSRSSRSRSPSYSSSSRSPRFSVERRRQYHRKHDSRQSKSSSASSNRCFRDRWRSPSYRRSSDSWFNQEKNRQVEERRVIYVGRLEEGITKAELRQRFEVFGPVVDISLHFRERGDNYGFVTFLYKNDAYEAVEHGNDDPTLPRYDLCFGGRRAFCKVKYADLDGINSVLATAPRSYLKHNEEESFDLLLKQAKAKLRNRQV